MAQTVALKVYYNFATKVSGEPFNPQKPINDSPNNTGLRELPPFQASMVWYSYDKSEEFPWVGDGGKNPMAGPVFYSEDFQNEDKFPEYFDGKLFIYEWMRNWIYLVKMDENGDIIKIDPFMPNTEFSRPMDMILGNDGKLYMLEYGTQWFARNQDARLVRIDYIKGNREPVAKIQADNTVGAAPLTVTFSAEDSYDFDEDDLKYEWSFSDDNSKNTTVFPSHTFTNPGIYSVTLKVTDPSGKVSTAKEEIQVGNEPPKIDLAVVGNQSFYWDNSPIDYKITTIDKEDGQDSNGVVDSKNVMVTFDYLPDGEDITLIAQGHQKNDGSQDKISTGIGPGKKLIAGSDCKTCHNIDKKVNGPSYLDIAKRYRTQGNVARKLARRIVNGSSGEWGSTAMAAHPQISLEDAVEMVSYILSLGEEQRTVSDYPTEGTLKAD